MALGDLLKVQFVSSPTLALFDFSIYSKPHEVRVPELVPLRFERRGAMYFFCEVQRVGHWVKRSAIVVYVLLL